MSTARLAHCLKIKFKHRGLVGKIFEIRSNNIIGKEFETSKALIIGMLQSCDSP